MINWKKEKGFSLVEVMILFAVFAALIAASIPMMTNRSKSVPIKIARGAYVCYRDAGGALHEVRFNRNQQIGDTVVDKCTFNSIPQASAYQITLIGAGAGGYNYADVDTVNSGDKYTFFSMKNGYTGEFVSNDGTVAWPGATADGKGMISDDDLWNYFKGQELSISALVPAGAKGQSINACFLNYDACKCCTRGTETEISTKPTTYYGTIGPVPAPTLSDLYNELKTTVTLDDGTLKHVYKYGTGTNENIQVYRYGANAVANQITIQVPTPGQDGLDNAETRTIKNSTNSKDTYDQKVAFCNNDTDRFGWGGQYRCTCTDKTYEGRPGGSGGYLNGSYTIGMNYNNGDYFYKKYYNKPTITNKYQAILKDMGASFASGSCTPSSSENECVFQSVVPSTVSSSTIDVANIPQYTNESTSVLNVNRPYCNKSTKSDDEGNVYSITCYAADGASVELRTAIRLPYNSWGANQTGKRVIGMKTSATGGGGVRIRQYFKAQNKDWRNMTPGADGEDATIDEAYKSYFTETQGTNNLPALRITTDMKKRVYKVGKAGGNGEMRTITRTKINGSCDINVGAPGKAHRGPDTQEYKDLVESGKGNTSISCTADGFQASVNAGETSASKDEDSYMYNRYDSRTTYSFKSSADDYETQAVQYLKRHGLNAALNFGQGGDGSAITDSCLKVGGMFKIERYNEFSNSGFEVLNSNDMNLPADSCYKQDAPYTTFGAQADKNGAVDSQYLKIVPAQDGQSGAVIITW